MKSLLISLSKIMHEFQNEQSYALLFNSDGGLVFSDTLKNKFLESDYATEGLSSVLPKLKSSTSPDPLIIRHTEELMEQIDIVSKFRDKILTQNPSITEIISTYSHKIIGPIINLIIETALNNEHYDAHTISAFSNFIQLKERISRERAFGLRGLIRNTVKNKEFIENYRFLVSEQEAYKNTFLALANDEQKKCYNNLISDYSFAKMEEMHHQLQDKDCIDNFDIKLIDWLNLATQKSNVLYSIQLDLIETLEKKEVPEIISCEPNTNTFTEDKENTTKNFVFKLPLFKGLSETDFNNLYRNSSIKVLKKGNLLFLEGELPNRLYILINGWVKLFKGTPGGNETIIQMLTGGDMIAESAVFLNAPYPISAQVAKSATILSIPAPIMREYLKNNNILSFNILTGMSLHSQMLIQGLENIRLKSTTERVGWFLLKLLIEQGRVPDLVELPYDKSLIASYLDMKPETFSRTLKKFKQKGFKINKDSIILPDVNALCGFCDTDTAHSCSKHGTPDCINPDCNQTIPFNCQ